MTKTILQAAVAAVIAMAANMVAAAPIYMTGNYGQDLYTVNSATGAGSLVGAFGASTTSTYTLGFNSSDTLYGIDAGSGWGNGVLETINTSTGAATTIGSGTGIADLMAMAFGPNGTLYVASWATNDLYTMNTTTGAATLVGSLGFGGVMDLAFDTSGDLYGIGSSLYEINTTTGAGTLVTNLSDTCLMGLGINSSNTFYATDYCNSDTPLYTLNTSTGNLTAVGNGTGIAGAMGVAFEPSPAAVPEPASIALMGIALAGLGIARRKKRA